VTTTPTTRKPRRRRTTKTAPEAVPMPAAQPAMSAELAALIVKAEAASDDERDTFNADMDAFEAEIRAHVAALAAGVAS